ncbi:hypothetical protein D7Z54_01335 [Salibacterium salarium]|uniref:ATP-dependent Lon protease n=1 Tax=Salibacterium salarium TaxID=284579 RepID=A0A428NA86_9BACI|nr:hypothetical protein [Salibacterium salarium]RSL35240.1 hypothetical protein D7Z54_01335 [Salibacterium salarium]
MYLLLSIVLSSILGWVLLMMGPLVGGFIAFGIVVGCLFRGLYLLIDIHKKLSTISPNKDKVQEAYDNYLKERNAE